MNFLEMSKKMKSRKFEDTVTVSDSVKVAIPKMDKSKKKYSFCCTMDSDMVL